MLSTTFSIRAGSHFEIIMHEAALSGPTTYHLTSAPTLFDMRNINCFSNVLLTSKILSEESDMTLVTA